MRTPVGPTEGFPASLLSDYAAVVARRRPGTLERTVTRSASLTGRKLLEHLATAGSGHEESTDGGAVPARIALHEDWGPALAYVLAVQNLQPSDRGRALQIYEEIDRGPGASSLARQHQRVHLDLLLESQAHQRAEEVLSRTSLPRSERPRYRADLLNPYLSSTAESFPSWLDRLNEMLPPEMRPVSVTPGTRTAFDGLWAPAQLRPTTGGLVSVVVSVHDPGPELMTSLNSIIRQSYRDLEILVVDDCSQRDPANLLESLESRDPRITVLRLGVNGGTYRCRNYALSLARGRFVTFHDDDDWAHPDRIAHQVAMMQREPGAVATMTRCVRADEDLRLTRIGYRETERNTSSLMFRRRPVLARIGFFDTVRKGGDTEFVLRLAACFGDQAVRQSSLVLSFVRIGRESLSSGDFRPGWSHRSRWAYKMLYSRWHAAITEGSRSALLADMSGSDRIFPAPRRLDPDGQRPDRFDVVVVGDWRAYGGPQKSMLAEIAALRAVGKVVAVAHLEAFRFMTVDDRPLCGPVLELIERGEVELLLLDDEVVADVVVLRYPPILQFLSDQPARWAVSRVLVVANQAPFEHDGSDHRYVPSACTDAARQVFGCTPLWVPQGPVIRQVLAPLLPAHLLAEVDMPGILDPRLWPRRTDLAPPNQDELVVGRVSRDTPNKFPVEPSQLRGAYSFPRGRVRMLGAEATVPRLLEADVPMNWELLAVNSVDVQQFLSSLHVFVYFDDPGTREAFGRVVLEAVASGCVVVLPPRYEETFGRAALYCEAEQVPELVENLRRDASRWQDHLRRARAVFEQRFSFDSYRELLSRLAQAPAIS